MRSKSLYALACVSAVLTMGIAMPSCPGQEAMQQQIEALQTQAQGQSKSIQNLSTQVKTLTEDMVQVKNLLAQVSNTVLAQKAAIEQLEVAAKAAAAAKPPHYVPQKNRSLRGGSIRPKY